MRNKNLIRVAISIILVALLDVKIEFEMLKKVYDLGLVSYIIQLPMLLLLCKIVLIILNFYLIIKLLKDKIISPLVFSFFLVLNISYIPFANNVVHWAGLKLIYPKYHSIGRIELENIVRRILIGHLFITISALVFYGLHRKKKR